MKSAMVALVVASKGDITAQLGRGQLCSAPSRGRPPPTRKATDKPAMRRPIKQPITIQMRSVHDHERGRGAPAGTAGTCRGTSSVNSGKNCARIRSA